MTRIKSKKVGAARRVTMAAVSVVLLGACGGDGGTDQPAAGNGETTPPVDANTDDSVDSSIDDTEIVRMASAAAPNTLDPHLATASDRNYVVAAYDRLAQLDPDSLDVLPMLATEWAADDSSNSIIVDLRPDVRFRDGEPFNADAVKASLERGISVEGSTVAGSLRSIASVDVVDDLTVRINLVEGQGAEVMLVLAEPAGAMISPRVLEDGRDLSGGPGDGAIGPYEVTMFVAGERVVYERASDQYLASYWDPSGRFAAGLDITYIADSSARINGVLSGQYHLTQATGNETANALRMVESGEIDGAGKWVMTGQHWFLQTSKGPLADPLVRKAVQFGVDREAIGSHLLEGTCRPSDQYYPSEHWAHNPEIAELYSYDPDRARALLSEAGVSNLEFDLGFVAGSSAETVAQALQTQMRDIGVIVNLVPGQRADLDPRFARGELDSYAGTISNAPDPSLFVSNWLLGGIGLVDDADGSIEARAAEALDPSWTTSQRAEVYHEMFFDVMDDAVYVDICQSLQQWIRNGEVVGLDEMLGVAGPNFRTLAIAADGP